MILVDTHIVLWLISQPEKLSRDAASVLQAARNHGDGLAISAATLYEVALLALKKRIDLQISAETLLQDLEERFVIRPINSRICAETMRLPESYPKDPIDRIIGATAIVEGLTLVTADTAIHQSKAVPTIW